MINYLYFITLLIVVGCSSDIPIPRDTEYQVEKTNQRLEKIINSYDFDYKYRENSDIAIFLDDNNKYYFVKSGENLNSILNNSKYLIEKNINENWLVYYLRKDKRLKPEIYLMKELWNDYTTVEMQKSSIDMIKKEMTKIESSIEEINHVLKLSQKEKEIIDSALFNTVQLSLFNSLMLEENAEVLYEVSNKLNTLSSDLNLLKEKSDTNTEAYQSAVNEIIGEIQRINNKLK